MATRNWRLLGLRRVRHRSTTDLRKGGDLSISELRRRLNTLHRRYNRREEIHSDPLGFVYRYDDPADREVSGLLASALAYGRVAQIHASVSRVLDEMGPSPAAYLRSTSGATIGRTFRGFRHRFSSGRDLTDLLLGTKRVLEHDGSLERRFIEELSGSPRDFLGAVTGFVDAMSPRRRSGGFSLLPSPADGSACKRLHLYLRWMIRRDEVDPGVWDVDAVADLVVPIDTHMYRIGHRLGFTGRSSADLRTAIEITDGFRRIAPADPVRYDFALTRLGMRSGLGDLLPPAGG